jgi:membrane protease subunit HflC
MPMENDPNGRGGPSTGRGPPPDIEELLRRGRSRLQGFLPGGGSRALIVAALLVGIVLLLWTSLFTVPSDSVAVVQRFGRYVEVVPAGLHVRLPLGIDTATIVPVKRQLKQEFGFTTPGASDPYQGGRDGRRETKRETEMVTGDLNAALVEWVVQYRISDPVKFLFEVREPSETLRYVSESVMREVVGDRTVDEVITIGRQEIESEALFKMQALSSKYAMGVSIDQVQLKNINPPEPVQESFNEVNQAQQEKEKLINEARRDYNKVIPLAEGEKDQRIREADGYRLKRINEAEGDTTRFTALLVEYTKAPEVTRRRVYMETLQSVLPEHTLQDHPRRRGAWAVALPRPQCALGGSAVNRVLRVVWPALLAIGVFLGADALYTVNEVEQMIITQFGKPVGDPVTSAGLKIKLPLIQHVNPIDKRVLEWDGSPSDMPTKDKLYISVDLFARWRITDPLQYFLRLRDERSAQSRLDDILGSETRNAVAKHELIEIIRTTRDRVPLRDTLLTDAERELNMGALVPIQKGRQRVEQEIFTAAAEKVRVFGIELLDIRFKRINYNESVRPKIYDRMISERRQIAERFLSEGNGEAARIRGNRVRDLNKIQSEAYRQVEEIRGVADATAARIYAAAYGGSPEAIAFFEFTRTMRAYQTIIADNTTLVLSTDSDLFKYLKGMNPDDQPLTTPSVEAQRQ